jgi:hypothetical protein
MFLRWVTPSSSSVALHLIDVEYFILWNGEKGPFVQNKFNEITKH